MAAPKPAPNDPANDALDPTNPLLVFLETITPKEAAALAYLAARDREEAEADAAYDAACDAAENPPRTASSR